MIFLFITIFYIVPISKKKEITDIGILSFLINLYLLNFSQPLLRSTILNFFLAYHLSLSPHHSLSHSFCLIRQNIIFPKESLSIISRNLPMRSIDLMGKFLENVDFLRYLRRILELH